MTSPLATIPRKRSQYYKFPARIVKRKSRSLPEGLTLTNLFILGAAGGTGSEVVGQPAPGEGGECDAQTAGPNSAAGSGAGVAALGGGQVQVEGGGVRHQ